ncbi:MAG: histidine kinase dimerization/phosphoacceptor domain -containing protein [Crocinitomicaceae bacterium]
MLKHYLLFITIILFTNLRVSAQENTLDFENLIDSAKKYSSHRAEDRDLAEVYFREAYKKLSSLNDPYSTAEYYFEKSFLSIMSNKPDLAEKECELGLMAIINKPKTITYYNLNRRMATNYYVNGNYDKSIIKFLDILFSINSNDYEAGLNSIKIKEIEAHALSSVGRINYILFAEKKSIDYFQKAIIKYDELNNESMLKHCYFGLANAYIEQGNLANAALYIDKGFKIPENKRNRIELSNFYLTYCHFLLEDNQLDSALFYIDTASSIMVQFGDLAGVNLANIYKGQYYYQSGDYSSALDILERTLMNMENGEVDRLLIKSQLLLAKTHAKIGNYGSAYRYMRMSLNLQNEILKNAEVFFSHEFENQLELNRNDYLDSIKSITGEYQLNKAQSELKEKSTANKFLLLIIAIFVILTPILFIILRINYKTNKKLNKTIDEKGILFKEVHHRVKNNFQVISSLMNLQKHTGLYPETDDILTQTQQRISSMALVHELLYQHDEVDEIDIGIYINELVASTRQAYNSEETDITFSINTNNIVLKLEQAIPLGLILNEAVTNSVKHAFNSQKQGKIVINLELVNDGKYFLLIGDNGIGIPESGLENNTLGLELIDVLTEQINGEKNIFNQNGTKIEIRFSV